MIENRNLVERLNTNYSNNGKLGQVKIMSKIQIKFTALFSKSEVRGGYL